VKILFLGYSHSPLIKFLENKGNKVIVSEDKINASFIIENQIDFVISYGYRHLIKKDVLEILPEKVINLHISYLPYNKGADPNFWSFIEDTPKGVTIHMVNEGLDTGDIILQQSVELSETDTLRTTYGILQNSIQKLFINHWDDINNQRIKPVKQRENGTLHKSADKEQYISTIKDKWLDMPIKELVDYVGELQMSRHFLEKYLDEIKEITSAR
jgi:methionyl-tRNA formyltransferase